MKPLPTAERVRELFEYRDGALIRRVFVSSGGLQGSVAGSKTRFGYMRVRVDGHHYYAHRIIWLLMMGSDPGDGIDHVNGDRSDNRIENLRQASTTENAWNRKRVTRNSPYKGAYQCRDKWYSCIRLVGGQRKYLGRFETAEKAHDAYVVAAKSHFGEFARSS